MLGQLDHVGPRSDATTAVNPVSLVFRDEVFEDKFRKDYAEGNLQMGRAWHIIALCFYCVVATWDILVIDSSRLEAWIWVMPIVAAVFLAGLASSYFMVAQYLRHWRQLFAFYVLATAAGFIVVSMLSRPDYPPYNFVGIIFCLLFCYAFIRLTVVPATLAGATIIVAYLACMGLYLRVPERQLYTEAFYLFGVDILGMVVCYALERRARRTFVLAELLEREKVEIQRVNTRLEQVVEKRTRELRTSDETFVSFFSQGNIGMAISSPDMGLLDVNRKLCEMLGYEREELLQKTWAEVTHPEDLQPDRALFESMVAREIDGYEIDERFIKKSGGDIYTHLTVSCLRGDDGSVSKMMATMQDISERKALEKQLLQAQKMESVGRLAGGVAHDYNNISSIIIGLSELALEGVEPGRPLHDHLTEIHKAAERSAEITRQLLAFASQQTIAPKVLDLNETIEGMLKMLRRLIGENVELLWEPVGEVWPVKIDPSQVDQILANLCVNARDAIVDVGRVCIETDNVSLDEDYCGEHAGCVPAEYVMLAVSDDGCGIEPDTMDKLFEPFFTTKRRGQGTGLGLATVYGIAKQNGGYVNVYSEPGEGTTIKIYLPRHWGVAVEKSEEAQPDLPLARGEEVVLLVEDDAALLELGKRMLEKLGYTVLAVNGPGAAIRTLEEHDGRVDALVTDVILPGMNGRELAERLQESRPSLAVVFMSGYTANIIAHKGVLDEGVHFLAKPFSVKEIAVKVREALDDERGVTN